ncbi:hypothetical protein [Rhizobium sp. Leaf383]|uniref:hypothetical protein n=1 Tax=Rhizobium sp. Leaf383 TaxID=1736357 RepID=UPI0007135B69|nr:hypothetical protein [Rhizobium sp. Leaf383]KQS84807.1 hypothetical protein ASG58_20120 [Rhizobium sp. Leaf383]
MSAPAHQAAIGNLGGMMLLGAGAVSLASGICDAIDAANDARRERAYCDSLGAAHAHAAEMEAMALAAVRMVAELEAEVGQLRQACAQSQNVIDALVSRR